MTALVDVALPLAGGSVSPGNGGTPPLTLTNRNGREQLLN